MANKKPSAARADMLPPGQDEVPFPVIAQDGIRGNVITLTFESMAATDHFSFWLEKGGGWAVFGDYVDSLP